MTAPSWLFNQSAVVPFRVRGDEIEVLLISSGGGKHWIVPKGVIEPDMTPQESAAAEAEEEAGVRGRVYMEPIGEYQYDKWGGTCQVVVYAMQVDEILDRWLEDDVRERRWVAIHDAASIVKSDLKPIVGTAAQLIPGLEI